MDNKLRQKIQDNKVEDLGITKVEDSRITQKVEDKDNAQKKGISKESISR